MAALLRHCTKLREEVNCINRISILLKTSPSTKGPVLSRCFSSQSSKLSNIFDEDYRINPYYGLLNLSGNLDIVIKPDLHNQCGSVCNVKIFSPDSSSTATATVNVSQSHNSEVLDVVGLSSASEGQYCQITLPVKYDITAAIRDEASLTINSLQNSSNHITTDKGSVTLNKLQSLDVDFKTDRGALYLGGKLLSSLNYTGKHLSLQGSSLQADSIKIDAQEELKLNLESIHSNSLVVTSDKTHLVVKNMTCNSRLRIREASLSVDNCSGSLDWQVDQGHVKCGVPELTKDSSIELQDGECYVACPLEYKYDINLFASDLLKHPKFINFKSKGSFIHQEIYISSTAGSPKLLVKTNAGKLVLVPWTWPSTSYEASF